MAFEGSVSRWIGLLKSGDAGAAQKLWERYYLRLVGLARAKLQGAPQRMADPEDVAQSAFHSFFQGANQGRFPQLADRNDLWRLLLVITARKAFDLRTRENRQKRGGGTVRPEAALGLEGGLDELMGDEPTPEFAVQVTEECRRLLDLLGDQVLRNVALAKMEGYTNEEIALQLGCVVRTVERKLRVIRSLWSKEMPS